MSKTIYIVTEGCYSDYGIRAVFSEKGLAERYCTVHQNAEIEEYEMDSWDQDSIMRKYYSVSLVIETGEVINAGNTGMAEAAPSARVLYEGNGPYRYSNNRIGVAASSFISPEHAMKLATDHRTKMLIEHDEGLRDDKYNLIEKVGVMFDE